jgi:hypothetical protein
MKIKHDLPTSAQMRAQLTANIKQGDWLGAFHNGPPLPPGTVIAGSIEPPDHLRYAAMGRTLRKRPTRKHISEKTCSGGHICLPGLGGKCVACSEDDEA